MPGGHSSAEYVTVELARKIFDLPVPVLRRLAESGRVAWRVPADGRPRLSMGDLRTLANTMDLADYHALLAAADAALTDAWRAEEERLEAAWSGHTTGDIWRHERAKWIKMGRVLPPRLRVRLAEDPRDEHRAPKSDPDPVV